MKRTALLAVAAFLLVAGPATAAPSAIRGVVVAKHARNGTVVVATGRKGVGVTVRVAPRRVRLGDRVSVVGKRLRNGTVRASGLRVLSHVRTARIRGLSTTTRRPPRVTDPAPWPCRVALRVGS